MCREKDVIITPIPHHLLQQLSTKNTTSYFTDFDALWLLLTRKFATLLMNVTPSKIMKPCMVRDHPYITSAKDWVGGSRKLSVLLTSSTYCIYADLTPQVGGCVRKSPKLCWRNIWMVPNWHLLMPVFLHQTSTKY